jgi:hypothetical protein
MVWWERRTFSPVETKTYKLEAHAPLPDVQIFPPQFMAANKNTVQDEVGGGSDWTRTEKFLMDRAEGGR